MCIFAYSFPWAFLDLLVNKPCNYERQCSLVYLMSEAEFKEKKRGFGVDNVILNFIFDSYYPSDFGKKYH